MSGPSRRWRTGLDWKGPLGPETGLLRARGQTVRPQVEVDRTFLLLAFQVFGEAEKGGGGLARSPRFAGAARTVLVPGPGGRTALRQSRGVNSTPASSRAPGARAAQVMVPAPRAPAGGGAGEGAAASSARTDATLRPSASVLARARRGEVPSTAPVAAAPVAGAPGAARRSEGLRSPQAPSQGPGVAQVVVAAPASVGAVTIAQKGASVEELQSAATAEAPAAGFRPEAIRTTAAAAPSTVTSSTVTSSIGSTRSASLPAQSAPIGSAGSAAGPMTPRSERLEAVSPDRLAPVPSPLARARLTDGLGPDLSVGGGASGPVAPGLKGAAGRRSPQAPVRGPGVAQVVVSAPGTGGPSPSVERSGPAVQSTRDLERGELGARLKPASSLLADARRVGVSTTSDRAPGATARPVQGAFPDVGGIRRSQSPVHGPGGSQVVVSAPGAGQAEVSVSANALTGSQTQRSSPVAGARDETAGLNPSRQSALPSDPAQSARLTPAPSPLGGARRTGDAVTAAGPVDSVSTPGVLQRTDAPGSPRAPARGPGVPQVVVSARVAGKDALSASPSAPGNSQARPAASALASEMPGQSASAREPSTGFRPASSPLADVRRTNSPVIAGSAAVPAEEVVQRVEGPRALREPMDGPGAPQLLASVPGARDARLTGSPTGASPAQGLPSSLSDQARSPSVDSAARSSPGARLTPAPPILKATQGAEDSSTTALTEPLALGATLRVSQRADGRRAPQPPLRGPGAPQVVVSVPGSAAEVAVPSLAPVQLSSGAAGIPVETPALDSAPGPSPRLRPSPSPLADARRGHEHVTEAGAAPVSDAGVLATRADGARAPQAPLRGPGAPQVVVSVPTVGAGTVSGVPGREAESPVLASPALASPALASPALASPGLASPALASPG